MSPESLKPIFDRLKLPTDIVDLAISFLSKNHEDITCAIKGTLKNIIPHEVLEFYGTYRNLSNMTIENDTKQPASMFGVADQQTFFDIFIATHN